LPHEFDSKQASKAQLSDAKHFNISMAIGIALIGLF
jgi:hypothetical protein